MDSIDNIREGIIAGDRFETAIKLGSWTGFQSRKGDYGAVDEKAVSDGLVKVSIEGIEAGGSRIISAAQVRAVKYLAANDLAIRDALLAGLLAKVPELKEIYDDYLPAITGTAALMEYTGLSYLHVMPAEKDGHAYIGFELGCTWDEEHGVGVMMHRERVISIGLADTAFNHWITFEDNGTLEEEEKKWEEANQRSLATPQEKKAWWKFW